MSSLLGDFLAATDPVRDLLLRADVASGLGRLSRVWTHEANGVVRAVAFAFPLWPELPSLGVKGRSPDDERALLSSLVASGEVSRGYVICDPAQRPLYDALGRAEDAHRELQMVLAASSWQRRQISGLRPATLAELDEFYRTQAAGAWNPVQFETGPYFVAEDAGRIVAAAGTHFAYDGLAQLGNVLTAPSHRGRGLARALTAAVAQALVEAGYPLLSLFVAEDNAPARRVYERLGFTVLRPLDAFGWQADREER